MADFLFLYRGGSSEDAQLSPEQMQDYMQQWGRWIQELSASGVMTQVGDALEDEGAVVNADKVVSDGPYAESKEMVGGFSIVQAQSLAAASQIAQGCPIFTTNGLVEVRPLAGMAPQD